jgi:hypothetical protein
MTASRDKHTSPAAAAQAITASDSTEYDDVRGVYVGVTGDVAVTFENGDSVVLVGLAAGTIHPIRAKKILATGTDATDIVIFF